MGITIKDVAKKVGVTPATISMVINNNSRISEATRQKVWQAIKELDYYPHAGARNLVLKRTHVIGVVATFFTSQFMLEALSGVEEEIRHTDYNLVLYGTRGLSKNEETIIHKLARSRKVDGLITLSLDLTDKQIAELKKFNVPLVCVERDYPEVDCILVNNEKGGYEATKHLLSLGHRRIGLVTGPPKEYSSMTREQGFQKAIKEAGIAFDPALRVQVVDYSRKEGLEAAAFFAALPNPPTAVFSAAGDLCALGILRGYKDRGIKVPQQVSVVGFDDLPVFELIEPPLTTVRQPIAKMGALALQRILSVLTDKVPIARQVFEPELVLRQSTAPLNK